MKKIRKIENITGNEINEFVEGEYWELEWFDPYVVEGIDSPSLKDYNRNRELDEAYIEEDTLDELVVFYYRQYIRQDWTIRVYNRVATDRFVRAALYLILETYSRFAPNALGMVGHKLLDQGNVREIVSLVKESWEKADEFSKILLRDYILELFLFWKQDDYKFAPTLSDSEMEFLESVYDSLPS